MASVEGSETKAAKLPWTGLLSRIQLAQLKTEIPNFTICPGYTSRFGNAPDGNGIVYPPGVTASLSQARTMLKKWAEKSKSPQWKWWSNHVEKVSDVKPITSHDILDGLNHDRWAQYAKAYKRIVVAQRSKLHHARRKATILKETEQEHGVARELLGLSRASSSNAGPSREQSADSG